MEYVVLIIDIICAVFAGMITQSKGRSWWLGALLGFFLCGVGVVIVLLIPPTPEARILSASSTIPAGTGGLTAGWYSDPQDSAQLRYWDRTWTQQTKPRPVEAAPERRALTPPPSIEAPHPDSVTSAGWYDDPLSSNRLRYHDGSGWSEKTADKEVIPPSPSLPPPQFDSSSPTGKHAAVESAGSAGSPPPKNANTGTDNLEALMNAVNETDGHGSPVAAEWESLAQVRPPAGWYVDPNSASQLRYWDGTMWTEAFAPRP